MPVDIQGLNPAVTIPPFDRLHKDKSGCWGVDLTDRLLFRTYRRGLECNFTRTYARSALAQCHPPGPGAHARPGCVGCPPQNPRPPPNGWRRHRLENAQWEAATIGGPWWIGIARTSDDSTTEALPTSAQVCRGRLTDFLLDEVLFW